MLGCSDIPREILVACPAGRVIASAAAAMQRVQRIAERSGPIGVDLPTLILLTLARGAPHR